MTGTEPKLQISTQPESDWFLTSIVEFVNKRGCELAITLHVGGLLVSGLLACYKNYFESVGLDVAEVFGAGNVPRSKANGEAAEESVPYFIHLREVRFYSTDGQAVPAKKIAWWRGRISEVSGFFFGRVE